MFKNSKILSGALILFSTIVVLVSFQNCGGGKFHSIPMTSVLLDNSNLSNNEQEPSRAAGIEILARPKPYLKDNSTEVQFAITDFNSSAVASVKCSIDNGTPQDCKSPYSIKALSEGDHTFEIKVLNSKNQESSLKISWIVDLTPAVVNISSGPSLVTSSTSASLIFSTIDSVGIEKIECRLNNVVINECVSPKTLSNVPEGANTFEVVVTDKAGNVQKDDYAWTVGPPDAEKTGTGPNFTNSHFNGVAISADGKQAYVADFELGTLVRIDLATGNRVVVSNAQTVSSTAKQVIRLTNVTLNKASTQAYVSSTSEIMRIDLSNGHRTPLSNVRVGTGPRFGFITGMAIDSNETFAYVISWRYIDINAQTFSTSIMRVNLATGDRTVVADEKTGSGSLLSPDSRGIVINSNATIAYVPVDGSLLLSVNLANGNRTAVSSANIGTGPSIGRSGIAINSAGTEVFVPAPYSYGQDSNMIVRVNLSSGNRTLVSGAKLGLGPVGYLPRIVLSPDGTQIFGISNNRSMESYKIMTMPPALIRVDIRSGNRLIKSKAPYTPLT